ncbi:arf-GAP with dual PH domain-containing protein 1 [Caerostris extrusa]|uniref:Arf-GAP with dual PH domain-containing protein 1 n=1 Tax=Caerostris extrusa TaxID=172846 RepID=A0AAV4Y1E9_CAEEX|nr:arf-GAP with dual PH domain-containing protein 1 [Caerostris extrusa]
MHETNEEKHNEITFTIKHGMQTHANKGNPAMERTFFRGTLLLPPLANTSPQIWHQYRTSNFLFLPLFLSGKDAKTKGAFYAAVSSFHFLIKLFFVSMLLLGTASCILGCLKKKADSEDADELAGLSEAKTKSLPPSTGEKIRKFKHGFRPLGRNKHGKPHMTHKILYRGQLLKQVLFLWRWPKEDVKN